MLYAYDMSFNFKEEMEMGFRPRQVQKESRDFVKAVDTATVAHLRSKEYNLNIVQPEVASTVVLVWLEEFAKHLAAETEANGNKPVEVVLDSIMTLGTTIRDSEEGEKEGNLVPFVTLGEVFKLGAKNDTSTED